MYIASVNWPFLWFYLSVAGALYPPLCFFFFRLYIFVLRIPKISWGTKKCHYWFSSLLPIWPGCLKSPLYSFRKHHQWKPFAYKKGFLDYDAKSRNNTKNRLGSTIFSQAYAFQMEMGQHLIYDIVFWKPFWTKGSVLFSILWVIFFLSLFSSLSLFSVCLSGVKMIFFLLLCSFSFLLFKLLQMMRLWYCLWHLNFIQRTISKWKQTW